MKNDREDLLRVATAMSNGAAIDWEGEERANKQLGSKLERLRTIEKITNAQRPLEKITNAQQTLDLEVSVSEREMAETTPIHDGADKEPLAPLPFSLWGSLRITSGLDTGGHGEVYRAYDPALQKDVALKLVRSDRAMDKRSTGRFLKEARRLARVRHHNVLTVHGVDTHHGRAGIWTDLIEGKTLEQLLQQQGALGWEEAALIGGTLCRALAAVHAEGLIHHDVKTSNIMREKGGRIVLMDFGTAVDRFDARAHPDSDAAIGTPRFMAPERFRGRDSGRSSDIYSLGVVLYRLVTMRFPIEAKDYSELAAKQERREWVSLHDVRPDLPQAFVRVVERALDPNPSRRFVTMGAMERALAAARGVAIDQHAVGTDDSVWKGIRTVLDTLWFRASLAIAAVLVAGIFLVNQPGSFEVESSLFRAGDGSEERLRDGGMVALGDQLFLEIKGAEAIYAYVLNADQAGEVFVLFPLPGLDLQNPLEAGSLHRLPGSADGVHKFWEVTSTGGRERFVLIASRDPLRDLEIDLAGIPRAGSESGVRLSADSMLKVRGIGGLSDAHPSEAGTSGQPFAGLVEGITSRAAGESGVWAWEIHLNNPGR